MKHEVNERERAQAQEDPQAQSNGPVMLETGLLAWEPGEQSGVVSDSESER